MLKDHLNNRPNLRTGEGMAATPWLFLGHLPGKHLHTQTMLSALGISVLAARNSALRNLVGSRAVKLAATPSLSMHMRNDVARRHDDSVLATMTATPRVAPPQRHRCTR